MLSFKSAETSSKSPKPNPDSVLELQQMTKSNENVKVIVKPMPDDLQKRINLLGNRK